MLYTRETTFAPITLSSTIIVSDPCYERDTWCAGKLTITPGVYQPKLFYTDEGKWGERVAKLGVYRIDALPAVKYTEAPFTVGVDSGQAGIFDDTIYPTGSTGDYGDVNSFYGKVCNTTLSAPKDDERSLLEEDLRALKRFLNRNDPTLNEYAEKQIKEKQALLDKLEPAAPDPQGGIIDGKGLVSLSGYGDGAYTCCIGIAKDGTTTSVEIAFIDEEDQ